ncbi:MAG: hydrogenase [Burkholderiaceae bacterium]|nr:hydrogenase [Burkholderiaceae bacterium]
MSLHPLIERLAQGSAACAVNAADHDAFVARPGTHVLCFCGDPVRFPEALDIAVVLPELQVASGGAFDIGVVTRADEDSIARRWGVQRWPSLVAVRDGLWLGSIAGMQDWDVYLRELNAILQAEPKRPPTIGIPVVSAGTTDACH